MEQEELDLRALFQILVRHLWLLLVLPLVAGGTAWLISHYYLTPIYQTSATLWIKGDPDTVDSGIYVARDLAKTYAEVAQSMSVANRAAKFMDMPGITGEDMFGLASAEPVRDTEILRLTVADPDPIMASRLANAFAKGVQEEIEQSQMVQRIYIVDAARVPAGPVKPNTRMNVTIALALGLMAAVGLAFLLEYLDTTIRTPDDLIRRLGGPVLATVPHIDVPEDPADKDPNRIPTGIAPIVVMQTQFNSSASEAFRVLRANLKFLGLDQPLKSILVTSAASSEGKSVTTANLAVAFAQAGERVCIVDADLRLPAQAQLFGADGSVGLTDVLLGRTSLEDALQYPLPGLALLASGPLPLNPSEMLGSKRLAHLLDRLQEQFDITIIDSVPTMGLADAVTLAPQVGGVLMVVKSGGVSYHEAARAKETLLAVKANLLGMILDGIRVRDQGYYYQKYYKYGYARRKVV